ncbi:hypothetical protein [Burkholderia lata]|uniref:hypothetical protein n=1 Tax=Burkholderia lata (strain ATCC 17760 / DSM 23089 / LMG 22485 / NCIMB 9086 / R18194 / 383) TaxID=482957 RepID=UPI001454B445|nr:hypothetical protein [Burkholderia lata]VWL96932.1 hypothetical protein BLA6992_01406 [Burkholderia lata]
MLRDMLNGMIAAIEQGQRLKLRRFAPPDGPVYENNVGKLGLLLGNAAEDTAFAIQQIRAFRLNFAIVLTYVCLEGEVGLGKRAKAWSIRKQCNLPSRLRFVTQPLDLRQSEDVADLCAAV